MDFKGTENIPFSENDERGISRNDDRMLAINDKQHKGELKRQSPVSDGETAIAVHGFEVQDDRFTNEREKSRLIEQVLALQSTLDDLSQRVDAVKDENLKLKSENQVLGQYIENLMAASNVFQTPDDPKSRKSSTKSSKKR